MNCSAIAHRAGLLLTITVALVVSGCEQAGTSAAAPVDPVISNVSANAGGPYAKLAEDPVVTFDASGTLDPDNEIAVYQWDFGDGQTRNGVQIIHTYPQLVGEYAVTLTVRNAGGLVLDSDTTRARIRLRPVATFDVQNHDELVIGTPVVFDASGSDDGDGLGFVRWYRWDFDYDPDDGFNLNQSTTSPQTQRVFTRPGEYPIALVVVDDDGFRSEIVTSSILVQDAEGAIIIIE
ncbi:MAG: PKD domain-containing protein [Spirochaetaceae bacterium]|nr:MAG: PKD domain-containing protein [Spirochaetaceae bacterium]